MKGRKDDEGGDSHRWFRMERTPLMYFCSAGFALNEGIYGVRTDRERHEPEVVQSWKFAKMACTRKRPTNARRRCKENTFSALSNYSNEVSGNRR